MALCVSSLGRWSRVRLVVLLRVRLLWWLRLLLRLRVVEVLLSVVDVAVLARFGCSREEVDRCPALEEG